MTLKTPLTRSLATFKPSRLDWTRMKLKWKVPLMFQTSIFKLTNWAIEFQWLTKKLMYLNRLLNAIKNFKCWRRRWKVNSKKSWQASQRSFSQQTPQLLVQVTFKWLARPCKQRCTAHYKCLNLILQVSSAEELISSRAPLKAQAAEWIEWSPRYPLTPRSMKQRFRSNMPKLLHSRRLRPQQSKSKTLKVN